jgi:hypothetical protein
MARRQRDEFQMQDRRSSAIDQIQTAWKDTRKDVFMSATKIDVKQELTPEEKRKFAQTIRLHEEFKQKHAGKVRRVKVGYVSVDSGQVIIVDPCHLHDGKPGPGGLQHSSRGWKYEQHYEECRRATTGGIDDRTGEARRAGSVLDGSAVASSTGWGDGTYPVYATILDDRVLKLEIKFADE